jgi:hypothetical protein
MPRIAMLGWKTSRIASSLMGLLGDAPAEPSADARFEQLRTAMLDVVFEAVDTEAPQTTIFLKLHKAPEVQTLWYLRSDLMMFLSEHMGESAAMKKLQDITALFEGAVPRQQIISAQRRRSSR